MQIAGYTSANSPQPTRPLVARPFVRHESAAAGTLIPMSASSLLSLSLFEKIATVLGRPKLRLDYDETSGNCRAKVSDHLTSAQPFVTGVPGTYVTSGADGELARYALTADTMYLRVIVENIGKSNPAEGCRVFVTSVTIGDRKTATPASQLQWAHMPVSRIDDRFEARTLHVGVPWTVDVCRVNAYERQLVLLSEHAERGGDSFAESGSYDVSLRAVGINWVSPGWMKLRVHFDVDNIDSLRAEVVSARREYRLS